MEKSVKVFGNEYFVDSFFNKPVKPKDVKYNKHNLQIGYVVKRGQVTKEIYTLDIEESFRACILGATRCLPVDTLVKTTKGYIPIEKAKKVLSYNFEKQIIEEKDCELHFFGKRKKTVIKTSLGDIFCSDNHEWFVKRDGNIVELEAKELSKTDKLLRFEEKLLEVDIFSVDFLNEDVEMVCLEVKDNHNFFIEDMILSHNSGKSFLLRGLSDRYAKLGHAVVNLNDTKGEMASSLFPVQDKFKHLLLPGETPQGFKILPLRPTFFRQIDEELKPHHHWYSIDGRAMTRADFMTLMNARSLPPNQQTALEVVYQELQRKLIHDKELRLDVDLINQIIDEEDDIVPATKRSLKFKFRPLQDSHFFVKEEEKNIVNAIKNGFIPCINVENFDSFGEGSFQFTEVLLSMVFREVRIARRAKKIPRVLVNFDEASRFIGNSRETSIKTEMLSSHDLDTKYQVDLCLQEDTLVKTKEGNKKIKDLDEEKDLVMSYNFENNKWEESGFKKIKTGRKKLLKISIGKEEVLCSPEHKFFVKKGAHIVERMAKDLSVNDDLVFSHNSMGMFNVTYGGHSKKAVENIKKSIKEKRGGYFGINNPNYNNKWNNIQKQEQSDKVKEWRKKNPIWSENQNSIRRNYWVGRKQTEEHIRKRSESMKGKIISEETKKKIVSTRNRTRAKAPTFVKVMWVNNWHNSYNKYREENDICFSEQHKKNIALGKKRIKELGIKKTKKDDISRLKKASSQRMHYKFMPDFVKEQNNINISNYAKKSWAKLDDEGKALRLRKIFVNSRKMNKLEKYTLMMLKQFGFNDFEFVGDFSRLVNGKAPDFVDEKKKVIIEVFHPKYKVRNYGSVKNYIEKRKKIFSDYKVFFFTDKLVYNLDFIVDLKRYYNVN